MRIIVIDGASRSSRKKEDTLISIVTQCGIPQVAEVIEIEHSLWKHRTMRKITEAVAAARFNEQIVFVAKSQGAWRLLDWMRKANPSVGFHRFHVVTIDPHRWIANEIGNGRFEMPKESAGRVVNLYQRNKYPKGLDVNFALSYRFGNPNIDHWNIIHTPEVREEIVRAIKRAASFDLSA